MTKRKVFIYFVLGLFCGGMLSFLLPFHSVEFLTLLFGEPTILSRIIVGVLGITLVITIMKPIIQYYKRLEN